MKNLAFKTFIITLAFFGGVYALLVFSSRYSQVVYHLAGILLALFTLFAFVMSELRKEKPETANQWAIVSGVSLWGFLGEYLEHIGWLDLAHWHYLPSLLMLTFFIIFLIKRKYLPYRFGFCFGMFLGIWGLHMLMINQFELLGKTHWLTYPSAIIIGIVAMISFIEIRRAKSINQKMAWTLILLLTSWTVLEYLWAWRFIPGPYSIS